LGRTTEIQKVSERLARQYLERFFPSLASFHRRGIDLQNPFVEVKGTTRTVPPLTKKEVADAISIEPDLLYCIVGLWETPKFFLFFGRDAASLPGGSRFELREIMLDKILSVLVSDYDVDPRLFREFLERFGSNGFNRKYPTITLLAQKSVLEYDPKLLSTLDRKAQSMLKQRIKDSINLLYPGLIRDPRSAIKIRTEWRQWRKEGLPYTADYIKRQRERIWILVNVQRDRRCTPKEFLAFRTADADKLPYAHSKMSRHRGIPTKLATTDMFAHPEKYPVIYATSLKNLVGKLKHLSL